MCTMIAEKASVAGSGKGPQGWFTLKQAYISYDHPHHAPFEHALSLGFVNEDNEDGGRVAVELSRESARQLATRILATLDRADGHEAA
ncbi:MAG: hypothetical protein GEU81_13860 [Nitriliruptorales bacterium]|nr:hypothetical protein [Nitriliruptorales bacterium]